ncbi:hypothetical protein GCM10027262_12980 [Nocardia tengchongensis]
MRAYRGRSVAPVAWQRARRPDPRMVPIELASGIPAILILGCCEALRILGDPEHFPADPRAWESSIPEGCPVMPIMEWGPSNLQGPADRPTAAYIGSRASSSAATANPMPRLAPVTSALLPAKFQLM